MSQSLQMRFLTVLDSTYKDRSTCERFRKSHYLNRGKNAMAMHSIENKHASFADKSSAPALVRFSRPHTVFGTMVSVASVSLMAVSAPNVIFFDIFGKAICSALCMNVAIVGLNQVYDKKIDMVNKPYLPLASGEFNASTALFIIAFSVLISVLFGVYSDSTPLICTLVSSLAFGLMYSVDIRMLHWKENPFLATSCILIVRALIVQIGFYCHALGSGFLGIELRRNLVFSIFFMCIYSVVIALFKDIPDVMGDAQEGIQTLSVRFGISSTFKICILLLTLAYSW